MHSESIPVFVFPAQELDLHSFWQPGLLSGDLQAGGGWRLVSDPNSSGSAASHRLVFLLH